MSEYKGLENVAGEIAGMAANSQPQHEQHIYEFAALMERYVRQAVPQLIRDYMNTVAVNVETYLNGKQTSTEELRAVIAAIIVEAMKQ